MPYWVESAITAICDEHGEIREYLSISNDITQRKRSVELKTATAEQLRQAMRFAKQGAAEYDVARDEVIVSDELLELLEDNSAVDRSKLPLGEFLKRYVVPEDQSFLLDKIHKGVGDSVVSDTTIKIDFRVRTAKGAVRMIHALGTFKDGGRAYGILQDVSDHKRALDESLEKSKQIEDILQSITDGFFAVDKDLKFTLVNPLFESLVGMHASNLIGKDARDLFPNLTKSSLNQFIKALQTCTYISESRRLVCVFSGHK
jgi:PAS domain-containing protein